MWILSQEVERLPSTAHAHSGYLELIFLHWIFHGACKSANRICLETFPQGPFDPPSKTPNLNRQSQITERLQFALPNGARSSRAPPSAYRPGNGGPHEPTGTSNP
ncbi:putative AC9 transposase [Fusarium oxysporum f. sp. albedinis]|nr:putative AC9 transposase [Fusarium oxysporum f. sp. albedinis]